MIYNVYLQRSTDVEWSSTLDLMVIYKICEVIPVTKNNQKLMKRCSNPGCLCVYKKRKKMGWKKLAESNQV